MSINRRQSTLFSFAEHPHLYLKCLLFYLPVFPFSALFVGFYFAGHYFEVINKQVQEILKLQNVPQIKRSQK